MITQKIKRHLLIAIAFLVILLYTSYGIAFGYLTIGAMIFFIIALAVLLTVSVLLIRLEEQTGPEISIMYHCLVDVSLFALIVYSSILAVNKLASHYQVSSIYYTLIPVIAISVLFVKNSIVNLFSAGFNIFQSKKHSDTLKIIEAKQDSANNLILKFQENADSHKNEVLDHLSGIIDIKHFTINVEASLNQIPGQLSGIVRHLEMIEDTVGVRYTEDELNQIKAAGIDMRLRKWNREMANTYLKIMIPTKKIDVLTLCKNGDVSGNIKMNKASYYISDSVKKYVMGELESSGKMHLKGYKAEEARKSDILYEKYSEALEDSEK